jgi:hypothetical protein
VNTPTTRHASPAANPRTGRGESALPPAGRGAKTQSLPFAALPHDLRKDPRLKGHRTAIVLATALLEYAPGVKSSCYPTNTRLAADLGCCEQTVRTALAALQAAGWIKIALGSNQPNGRRIWLTWRCPQPITQPFIPAPSHLSDTPQSVGPLPQPAGGPLKPTGPEEEIVIEEGIEEESSQFARAIERPRGEPELAPLAVPAQPPALEQAAEPTLVPPPLAPPAEALPVPAQALPPASEAGPQDAPRAVPVPPAGPAPHRSPPPLSSPAKVGPAPVLTPEQQARLDTLPAATRDLVLTWLMTGDRILVAEARKKLAPPPRRPAAPRTLPEVLGRIREDPSFPSLAADWLSSALEDRKSYSGFKARCEEAWRGELEPRRLVAAYEQATGPKARNRGALFMHAVRQKE